MTKQRFTGLYQVVQLRLQAALDQGQPHQINGMIVPAARRYHDLDALLSVWRGETPLSRQAWSYRRIATTLRDLTGVDASHEAIRNWDSKRRAAARKPGAK